MRKTGFIFGMAMALALMGAAMVSEASEQTDNEEAVSAVSEREDIIASGVDGNLTWVIDADGKLTITGTGDYISKAWLDYVDQILTAEVNVTGITSTEGMFGGCKNLQSIDIRGLDTSKVKSMNRMFYECNSLSSLDLSSFDTGNVIDMDGMFYFCDNLSSVDLTSFDTSHVEYMSDMFSNCSSLSNLDLSNFNTKNLKGMNYMFRACSSLTNLDLSNFDTSNLMSLYCTFIGCSNLRSLNLSSFDLSKFTYEYSMGYGSFIGWCENLEVIYTPYNLIQSVLLPSISGFVWRLPDGTEVAELPQNLDHSVMLTRYDVGQVHNFVSRMYTVALGRDAEEAGLNDWTNRLLSHEIDGAGIANGFIMSEEFDNKKVSNETYVDILYRTFFDREADEGGRTDWLTKLANGNSRAFVLAGFVNSVEFDNLCNRYGIVRGEMQTNETAIGSGVRQFVERCYNKVLGREGEAAGIEDWTGRIARGEESPESVAKLFFFSEEYANKNTDNETFVETLYQTFMGRDSDPAGKADWVGRLSSGISREEVLEGFSRSEEFAEIVKSFGL